MDEKKLTKILLETGMLLRRRKLPSIAELRRLGASYGAAKKLRYLLEHIPATEDVMVEEGTFDDPYQAAIYADPWKANK